jgi:hypothetical protein
MSNPSGEKLKTKQNLVYLFFLRGFSMSAVVTNSVACLLQITIKGHSMVLYSHILLHYTGSVFYLTNILCSFLLAQLCYTHMPTHCQSEPFLIWVCWVMCQLLSVHILHHTQQTLRCRLWNKTEFSELVPSWSAWYRNKPHTFFYMTFTVHLQFTV